MNTSPRLFKSLALGLLAWAALGAPARAITFSGFESSAAFKPGTERSLPTLMGSSDYYLKAELLEKDPSWSAAAATVPGLFRLCYQVQARPSYLLVDGPTNLSLPLVVTLNPQDPAITEQNFNIWTLYEHPEQFTFRFALDLDGNGQFAPAEIQEARLTREAPGSRRWQARLSYGLGDIKSGDGKAAVRRLTLSGYDYGRADFEKVQAGALRVLSRRVYLGRSLQVSGEISLPHRIEFPTTNGSAMLTLKESYTGNALSFPRYQFATKGQVHVIYSTQGPEAAPLSEPLLIDGKWLAIKQISADLSRVTLAEVEGSAPRPARAQPGDSLPDFTRADVLTRRFIKSPELKGKIVVLVFAGPTRSYFDLEPLYNGFRLMSERLRQAGGDRVAVAFVTTDVRMEALLVALAGQEVLPFTILLDRDPQPARRSASEPLKAAVPDLSQIFYRDRDKPLTIVADPSGKIIRREEQDLYPLLRQVISLLKPVGQPGK